MKKDDWIKVIGLVVTALATGYGIIHSLESKIADLDKHIAVLEAKQESKNEAIVNAFDSIQREIGLLNKESPTHRALSAALE